MEEYKMRSGILLVKLHYAQGKNEISNEQGVQIAGNHEPNETGGFSPRELIEAAVALCTSVTLEFVLKRDGKDIDMDDIAIQVTASKEDGVKNRFTDFEVDVTLPEAIAADEQYVTKLLKVVERGCTVSNTIINGANVKLKAK